MPKPLESMIKKPFLSLDMKLWINTIKRQAVLINYKM